MAGLLHTLNKGSAAGDCLAQCLRLCDKEDALLLLEDGVYAAVAGSADAGQLARAPTPALYALEADVRARGLEGRLASVVTVIDDAHFVELCAEYRSVQSWY